MQDSADHSESQEVFDAANRHINQDRLERELPMLDALTACNLAHVLMLTRQELLPRKTGQKLLNKLLDIAERGVDAIGELEGDQGLYLAYEARLIEELGPQVGGAIHTARSRNDLGATMHRISTREKLLSIIEAVLKLRQALLQEAEEQLETVMTGYTHHQPAQPITFAHWLLAVEAHFARDTQRLQQALERTNVCPLGACALAGTDFAVSPQETAALLGFSGVVDNSLDAVAARDYALEAASAFSILATTLSRFAADLQFWFAHELKLVDLPEHLAGISSIMPQKRNPVLFEWLKGRAGHVMGQVQQMLLSQKNTSYSNVIDVNRESLRAFPQACEDITAMLEVAEAVVRGVVPQEDTMLRAATKNFSTVTLLANYLVREHELAFRTAYNIVKSVVREALKEGLVATELTPEHVAEAAQAAVGISIEIEAEVLNELLDPQTNVQRLQFGAGPAPALNRQTVAKRKAVLDTDNSERLAFEQRLEAAHEELMAACRAAAAN